MIIIIHLFILIMAVVCHEYAHAWVAYRRGDPTAKILGRLTLNPIKHIDPLGTLVIPFVLKLLGLPILGWAKPVPVDFRRLHHPRRDMIGVAAAGPVVNFFLAFVASRLLSLVPLSVQPFVAFAVILNLLLALFNLTPIPPLDGSRILMGILPSRWAASYARLEPFGLLIVLVLLNTSVLQWLWQVVLLLAVTLGVRPWHLHLGV